MGSVDASRERRDALRRLRAAAEFGACTRGDLLGAGVRRPLTAVLADQRTAARAFGLRGVEVQQRWARLVAAASDSPTALGFVVVDGSLRDLVARLGVDDDALLRNLRTWGAKRPPIAVSGETAPSGGRRQGRPSAVVQVPLLTAWLLWTAEARSVLHRGIQGYIGAERIRQVAEALIARGMPPPPEKTLLPLDADRLVRLASSR